MMVLKNKCIVFLFIILFALSFPFSVYAEEGESPSEAATQSNVSNDDSGESDAGQSQAPSEQQNPVVNEIVNIASDPIVYETEKEVAGGLWKTLSLKLL